MKNSDLCICILDETILAYHRHNEQGWLGLNIKGERAYHHQGQAEDVNDVLQECNELLNLDDLLQEINLHVVYADRQTNLAMMFLNKATKVYKNQKFISRPLAQVYQYYADKNKNAKQPALDDIDDAWIQNHLLILLDFDSSWRQAQKHLSDIKQKQQEYLNQQKIDELTFSKHQTQKQQEKSALEKQIRDKKQELAVVLAPEMESLLSFLPSIFKDFWTVVRPDELANIAGLLTPPQIPSPIQNPSDQAVKSKLRQFVLLDDDQQTQIIGFCRLLKQDFDLTIHIQFRPLIGDLD